MDKWKEFKIEKLFKIKSGDFIKRKDISENKDFPVYGGNGITGFTESFNLEGENIIIGRVGAKCGNVRFINDKIWLTDNAFYISEYFEELDKQFLKLFLEYYDLGSTANQAAQPVISFKGIKNIKIPLPPLLEQKRIVAKLDGLFEKIDRAIGLLEENIAHTEALMGSVLDETYSNGNIKLKEVCVISPKKSEVREMEDDLEVSFLPMKDLNEHEINFISTETRKKGEVYKGYTYFAEGDVILAKVTPCFENGKAGLAKELVNGIGFGSSEYHILRAKDNVLPEWIYFAVLTQQFRVTGKENMTGAGGLKRVPRPFLEEWKIPVPEKSIQRKTIKRILQTQERTKQLKSSIEIKLNYLKALKSSLLDQAFKGEL